MKRDISAVVIPWLSLSLAGAFVAWTGSLSPAELANATPAFAAYLVALALALPVAGVACGLLAKFGAAPWLARLGFAAGLVYAGCLKATGFGPAPWIGLALALLAVLPLARRPVPMTPLLVLLHGMGTVCGFYLALNLDKFLAGWPDFVDVLRGLLQLVGP